MLLVENSNPFADIAEVIKIIDLGARSRDDVWAKFAGTADKVRYRLSKIDMSKVQAALLPFGMFIMSPGRLYCNRGEFILVDAEKEFDIRKDIHPESWMVFQMIQENYGARVEKLRDMILWIRCREVLSIFEEVAEKLGCLEEYEAILYSRRIHKKKLSQ